MLKVPANPSWLMFLSQVYESGLKYHLLKRLISWKTKVKRYIFRFSNHFSYHCLKWLMIYDRTIIMILQSRTCLYRGCVPLILFKKKNKLCFIYLHYFRSDFNRFFNIHLLYKYNGEDFLSYLNLCLKLFLYTFSFTIKYDQIIHVLCASI